MSSNQAIDLSASNAATAILKPMVSERYEDFEVQFTGDAWFNATQVAARFAKEPGEWLRLASTQRYIAALERSVVTTGNSHSFVRTVEGRNGGTWLHPKLGVPFARWCDADFAVWCDDQVSMIISGAHPKLRRHAVALPNFEDPAESAEAWATQFRARVAAESETTRLLLASVELEKDAEFVKKYVEADGLLGIRSTCQAIDVENEREFTWFLVNARRCCYRLEKHIVPRAEHRHAKRFKVKTGIDHDTNRAYTTAKVTAKGVTWLAREWAEYNLDRAAYIAKHAPKEGDVDHEVEDATREAAERRAAKEAK